jgi:hypothetical protein
MGASGDGAIAESMSDASTTQIGTLRPVGQIDRLWHEVGRCQPFPDAKFIVLRPLVDQHDHARPGVLADFGVLQRPRLRVRALWRAFGRIRIRLTNQIATHRGPDDVGFVHQVDVEEIARRQQVAQGEHAELEVAFQEFHGASINDGWPRY